MRHLRKLTMPHQPRCAYASASLETRQHTDGRWMWGAGWFAGETGESYGAIPDGNRFTATEDAALLEAIRAVSAAMQRPRVFVQPGRPFIEEWLQTVASDVQQPSLFGGLE